MPDAPDAQTASEREVRSGKRARRIAVIAAGAAGLVIGAAAVGGVWALTDHDDASPRPRQTESSSPTQPETFTLTGTFQLMDGVVSDGSGGCEGSEGYADIAEGTAVTVYDAGGDVIATGYLGASSGSPGATCTFEVAIDDVPANESFYKVEVSHRGTVQLSREEAETGQLGMTLG